MPFTIYSKNQQGIDVIIIANTSTETSCSIIAGYGAALNSFRFAKQEWIDGYSSVNQMITQPFKGVVLAPFPNRISKAAYSFEGKNYQLNINREKEQNAIHGLLYNKAFEVIDEEILEKEASVVLSYFYEGNEPGFPFEFQINITYTLHENDTLEIETIVTNDGESTMPFGLGFHPYFKTTEGINQSNITFPPCNEIIADDKLIPTGKSKTFLAKASKLKGKDCQFDTCFELTDSKNIEFQLEDTKTGKRIAISGQSLKEFPFFQLYTPANRESIAIEPMTCPANAFNSKIGLQILQPDKVYTFNWKIKGI